MIEYVSQWTLVFLCLYQHSPSPEFIALTFDVISFFTPIYSYRKILPKPTLKNIWSSIYGSIIWVITKLVFVTQFCECCNLLVLGRLTTSEISVYTYILKIFSDFFQLPWISSFNKLHTLDRIQTLLLANRWICSGIFIDYSLIEPWNKNYVKCKEWNLSIENQSFFHQATVTLVYSTNLLLYYMNNVLLVTEY